MVLKELSTSALHDLYTQVFSLCQEQSVLGEYLRSTDALANIIVEQDQRIMDNETRLRKMCEAKDDAALRQCYQRLCTVDYCPEISTTRYQYRLACAREIARRAQSNEQF